MKDGRAPVTSPDDPRIVVIGNLAATLYGSPITTYDANICPARDDDNLRALAAALRELRARIRAPGVPEGLPFACDAAFLIAGRRHELCGRACRARVRDARGRQHADDLGQQAHSMM